MVYDRFSELSENLIIYGTAASAVSGFGIGICYAHQIPTDFPGYLFGSVPFLGGAVQGISTTKDMFDTAEQFGEDSKERSVLKEGALMSLGMMGMVTGPAYMLGLGLGTLAGLATGGYRNWI